MQIYSITSQNVRAELSDIGGKLTSLCLDGENLLWQGEPVYWDDRAPILFPFCGRCRDDSYLWQGERYPMPIHGFLPATPMEAADRGADFVCFRLCASKATRAVYPFDFTLELTYRALPGTLVLEIVLTAVDRPVPFSVGAHPGFVLPGEGNYRLALAPGALPLALEITESGLLGRGRTPISPDSDGFLTLTPDLLGKCGLFLQGVEESVILCRAGSARSVRISWEGMDTLGLWQPEGAPFICVEPWAGLPALDGEVTDLAIKPGIRIATPGYPMRFGVRVEIL